MFQGIEIAFFYTNLCDFTVFIVKFTNSVKVKVYFTQTKID